MRETGPKQAASKAAAAALLDLYLRLNAAKFCYSSKVLNKKLIKSNSGKENKRAAHCFCGKLQQLNESFTLGGVS